MKRLRLKPLLIGLAVLLLIAGLIALQAVRELRQESKDRSLIAAVKRADPDNVKRADADEIVRLLNEGADANAKDLPKDTRPFWRVCWDILRHRHTDAENKAPTVLSMVFRPTMVFSGGYPTMGASDLAQHTQVVKCLLEHGANPNVVDYDAEDRVVLLWRMHVAPGMGKQPFYLCSMAPK